MTEPTERDMIRSKIIAEYGTPTSSTVATAAIKVFRHQACDQKGFVQPDLPAEQTFTAADVAAAREEGQREAIEDCAKAALAAQLPTGYQWGHDAMEQFNFGKKRAAEAIRALATKDIK